MSRQPSLSFDLATCNASCGGGTQGRVVTITTYPQNGGLACPVVSSRPCNLQSCSGGAVPSPSASSCPTLGNTTVGGSNSSLDCIGGVWTITTPVNITTNTTFPASILLGANTSATANFNVTGTLSLAPSVTLKLQGSIVSVTGSFPLDVSHPSDFISSGNLVLSTNSTLQLQGTGSKLVVGGCPQLDGSEIRLTNVSTDALNATADGYSATLLSFNGSCSVTPPSKVLSIPNPHPNPNIILPQISVQPSNPCLQAQNSRSSVSQSSLSVVFSLTDQCATEEQSNLALIIGTDLRFSPSVSLLC